MRASQYLDVLPEASTPSVCWVLAFGDPEAYRDRYLALRGCFPKALITGCSSAGVIAGERVDDSPLVVTAIEMDHTIVRCAEVALADHDNDSHRAGQALARGLETEGLRHVLLLADGLRVNGSALIEGVSQILRLPVGITGGLAGDGERFGRTSVYFNERIRSEHLLAIGLYGARLRIGYGSQGGWDCFGPERLITRSEHNVLYELDYRPALELYKSYLGEFASGLPASGLKFPLALRGPDGKPGVVRTILSTNESTGSMTFAGDMPVGAYARLMKANFDRLVDGAAGAAAEAHATLHDQSAALAVLISCVGRRMVLGQAVEEEVEAVRETLGRHPVLCGFYSYGEISPLHVGGPCSLHNQTMTITTFSEA